MKIVAKTVQAFEFDTPKGKILMTEVGFLDGVVKLVDAKNRTLLAYRQPGSVNLVNEVMKNCAELHIIAGSPLLLLDLGIEDAKNVAEVTRPLGT